MEAICRRIPPPVDSRLLLRAVTHAIGEASRMAGAGGREGVPSGAGSGALPGALRTLPGTGAFAPAARAQPAAYRASFVPAPSPSPSPVLNQEELYSVAGWVDDTPHSAPAGGAGSRCASDGSQRGQRGASAGRAAGSCASSSFGSRSASPTAGFSSSDEDEDGVVGLREGARGSAAELDADAHDEQVSRRMAALVSQSIELAPLTALAPARLPIDRVAASRLQRRLAGAEAEGGAAHDNGGGDGARSPDRARGGEGAGGPADTAAAPCSLSEIYRLSNLNKRRNKQPRKALSTLLAYASPAAPDHLGAQGGRAERQVGDEAGAEREETDSEFGSEEEELRSALAAHAAAVDGGGGSDGEADATGGADGGGRGGGGRAGAGAGATLERPARASEDPMVFMERIGWVLKGHGAATAAAAGRASSGGSAAGAAPGGAGGSQEDVLTTCAVAGCASALCAPAGGCADSSAGGGYHGWTEVAAGGCCPKSTSCAAAAATAAAGTGAGAGGPCSFGGSRGNKPGAQPQPQAYGCGCNVVQGGAQTASCSFAAAAAGCGTCCGGQAALCNAAQGHRQPQQQPSHAQQQHAQRQHGGGGRGRNRPHGGQGRSKQSNAAAGAGGTCGASAGACGPGQGSGQYGGSAPWVGAMPAHGVSSACCAPYGQQQPQLIPQPQPQPRGGHCRSDAGQPLAMHAAGALQGQAHCYRPLNPQPQQRAPMCPAAAATAGAAVAAAVAAAGCGGGMHACAQQLRAAGGCCCAPSQPPLPIGAPPAQQLQQQAAAAHHYQQYMQQQLALNGPQVATQRGGGEHEVSSAIMAGRLPGRAHARQPQAALPVGPQWGPSALQMQGGGAAGLLGSVPLNRLEHLGACGGHAGVLGSGRAPGRPVAGACGGANAQHPAHQQQHAPNAPGQYSLGLGPPGGQCQW